MPLEMKDSVWELLSDPIDHFMMGQTAENLAQKYGITREKQDEIVLRSHQNAIDASKSGRFKEEIVSVTLALKNKTKVVDADEHDLNKRSGKVMAVKAIGVIGAGTMGAGIAQVALMAG